MPIQPQGQTERAVVDRFEGATAVLLVGESRRLVSIARAELPSGAREGSWLVVEFRNGAVASCSLDAAATQEAKKRILGKLERLRRGEHRTPPNAEA